MTIARAALVQATWTSVYLQHDGMDQTLVGYGSGVIAALNPAGLAPW